MGRGWAEVATEMKTGKLTPRLIGWFSLIALLAVALAGLRGAGRWLVEEDPLSPAQVIVVLSGGMPYRAEEAGKIFRGGYAPEVWVSRPESPAGEMQRLGIHFVGEEEYNREILIREGVPQAAIRTLPDTIVDTEQEVEETAREMRRAGKSRIIIVTSPEHTRRVKTLWKKLVGDNPRAIVRTAPEDPFRPEHWWRNTRDAFAVVREVLGLMNAWAGLPVRPHPNPN
jgi:uncharacterized SAM-binding protein YcdF (DUF218 family)